jgi:SOS-response transcriptional repressor LexA
MAGMVDSTKSSLGSQIRSARREKNLTLVELSNQIGISNQALSDIERGKKNPSKQTLMNLSRELNEGFGIEWLELLRARRSVEVGASLQKHWTQNEKQKLKALFDRFLNLEFPVEDTNLITVDEVAKGTVTIPIHGSITATGRHRPQKEEETLIIPSRIAKPGVNYALRVEGDSLRDALIGSGDLVVINENTQDVDGKFAAVYLDKKILLRRIFIKNNKARLIPANKDYHAESISLDKLNCFGIVTGVLRSVE